MFTLKGIFNFNSPLMRGLAVLFDLVILNALFVICSLPVVTIGAAYAALQRVTQNVVFDTGTGVVREYFRAFKQNYKQATTAWIGVIVFSIIWLYALTSVSTVFAGATAIIAYAILAVAMALFISIAQYQFALLVRYENSLKRHLLNAFILTFHKKSKSLIIAFFGVAPMILQYNQAGTVLFVELLVGFSLYSYCVSVLMKPVFQELEQLHGSDYEEAYLPE